MLLIGAGWVILVGAGGVVDRSRWAILLGAGGVVDRRRMGYSTCRCRRCC